MSTPKKTRKPTAPKPRAGAPESGQTKETFPRRKAPPGEVGLANETRPGLGTRFNEPFPGEPHGGQPPPGAEPQEGDTVAQHQHSSIEPNDKPLPREPQEQAPDSWAHEAERSTGVSGHTSYS
jgi:hypothetical protein